MFMCVSGGVAVLAEERNKRQRKKVKNADSSKMQNIKSSLVCAKPNRLFVHQHVKKKSFQTPAEEPFLFLLRLDSNKEGQRSILSLTGATLYLLGRLTGRGSVLGRHCSAKTQQHMTREVCILAGSRGASRVGCLRCAVRNAGSHTAAGSRATSL